MPRGRVINGICFALLKLDGDGECFAVLFGAKGLRFRGFRSAELSSERIFDDMNIGRGAF